MQGKNLCVVRKTDIDKREIEQSRRNAFTDLTAFLYILTYLLTPDLLEEGVPLLAHRPERVVVERHEQAVVGIAILVVQCVVPRKAKKKTQRVS
jgi:hypothetical protein